MLRMVCLSRDQPFFYLQDRFCVKLLGGGSVDGAGAYLDSKEIQHIYIQDTLHASCPEFHSNCYHHAEAETQEPNVYCELHMFVCNHQKSQHRI